MGVGASLKPYMKKILLVIPWSPLHPAGVSIVVRNLFEQYKQAGIDVMLCEDNWKHTSPMLDEGGWILFRLGIYGGSKFVALLKSLIVAPLRLCKLAFWLRGNSISAVNFHYVGTSSVSVAILKKMGVFRGNIVLSFHGTDVDAPKNGVERLIYKFMLANADTLTFCSKSLLQKAQTVFGYVHRDARVMYNGVDLAVFRPGLAAFPALPLRYFVQVGTFIPRKRQAFLVDVFSRLSSSYPDLNLVLIGMEGPELESVRNASARYGLEGRVHVLIGLEPSQVAAALSNAVLCVQPSINEPFGIAAIEAGACGTPVVASRVEGHLETIEHDRTGLLFNADDIEDCCLNIRRTLDNDSFAREIAMRFRQSVSERFTWASCARAYLETCAPQLR